MVEWEDGAGGPGCRSGRRRRRRHGGWRAVLMEGARAVVAWHDEQVQVQMQAQGPLGRYVSCPVIIRRKGRRRCGDGAATAATLATCGR